MGWWRPREVSGPTRLSHSRGSCHSAAKVSASRTDWITRPRGEGLGLDVDWRLKVFCPAFLQKSGRGPGAEPWPRAAARGTLLCQRSAGGGQRGNPRRGFPLCGRPKPPAAPTRRRGAGGGRRKGSSRTPTPTAGGKRAMCRIIYRETIPRPGGGRWNAVGSAEAVTAGRRGRRPLRGSRNAVGLAVIPPLRDCFGFWRGRICFCRVGRVAACAPHLPGCKNAPPHTAAGRDNNKRAAMARPSFFAITPRLWRRRGNSPCRCRRRRTCPDR